MSRWDGPRPVATAETAPFWDALRRHEVQICRCERCRHWVHPPLPVCPRCQGRALAFEPVTGRGTVYSFTEVTREFVPGVPAPYVAALVELDEQEGLRIVTLLTGTASPEIGQRVTAVFDDIDEATTLLYFEVVPDGA